MASVGCWPELTNWAPATHNGTEHEHHAAFLSAPGGVRRGLNPSLFSDEPLAKFANRAIFCVLAGTDDGWVQAGLVLGGVRRNIWSTARTSTPNMRRHLTLTAPRTRRKAAPNSSFKRPLTRSTMVRKS